MVSIASQLYKDIKVRLTERVNKGHLILFVAVLTNLVATALTGFSIRLLGEGN